MTTNQQSLTGEGSQAPSRSSLPSGVTRTQSEFPLSHHFYRVWQRNRDVFLKLWKSELVFPFFEPLFTLLAIGVGLGVYVQLSGGQSYAQFLAPGLVAAYPMFIATFETSYGSYIRMELQRTFDAMIATPLGLEDVIAGEISWAATRGLLTSVSVLIVITAFGLVSSPWALLTVPLGFLEGFLFGAVAICFTAVQKSLNWYAYLFTLYVSPQFLFSGVFFPLTELPWPLKVVAWLLPLTHAVPVARALVTGQFAWDLLGELAWLLVVSMVAFVLALVLMRRRLIK